MPRTSALAPRPGAPTQGSRGLGCGDALARQLTVSRRGSGRARAQSVYHSPREGIGLALGVGPEQKMGHFVVDDLDPHALALIDAPALPIGRMDQVDNAVFESFTGSFAPVDILVPFDFRASYCVKPADAGNRTIKRAFFMALEK